MQIYYFRYTLQDISRCSMVCGDISLLFLLSDTISASFVSYLRHYLFGESKSMGRMLFDVNLKIKLILFFQSFHIRGDVLG